MDKRDYSQRWGGGWLSPTCETETGAIEVAEDSMDPVITGCVLCSFPDSPVFCFDVAID